MVIPAHLETLEDLAKEHLAIAKDIFEGQGKSAAILIGYSGMKRLVIPLAFQNDEHKEMILKMAVMIFAVNRVKRYSVTYEAWCLDGAGSEKEYDRLQKEGLRISDSPLRSELLMCMAISRKERLIISYKILEDRSLKEIDKKDKWDHIGGIFSNLLPPSEPDEKTIRLMKAALSFASLNYKIETLQ